MILLTCSCSERRPAPRGWASFSLVELLVVMAIIAILVGVSIPTVTAVIESSNISRGGQQLTDQINLARQIASARNCTVELRMIVVPSASTTGFSALQLWTNAAGSTSMASATRPTYLPQNIIISPNTTLSKALASLAASTTIASGSGPFSGYSYQAFDITASGVVTTTSVGGSTTATGIINMSNFFLTVIPARYAANATLPKNYVMVQINPLTATPLVYRP